MDIHKRKDEVIAKLQSVKQWEERFKLILLYGRNLLPFPENRKDQETLVPGCLSKVWLIAEFKEGKVFYFADAEAALVKGMMAILISIYSGSTPKEILALKPDFLREVGIAQHLSMNRRNGLANMAKLIHHYANNFVDKETISYQERGCP